jgi:GAF domain-containing protein
VRRRGASDATDAIHESEVARLSGELNDALQLGVPMVRDKQVVGAIFVARRQPGLFSDAQVQLLKTFADQAVIAIENVRLFKETKTSLEQQTATADVLKIISRSTFDLRTVLQTLLESAARFCGADKASIIREKDGAFYAAEAYVRSGLAVPMVRDEQVVGGIFVARRQPGLFSDPQVQLLKTFAERAAR